ncbi:LacI family transcriptional regulator [Paenibacillus sp. TRM 82003]|uniref:LacI family DNA-binding transcriptional regulator n=1 Tax=Kineococcus sp. TRM81007 TaxID=2925831 RepID=UPI001F5A9FED|nr:LacI family DNA-binding transcriptional regulator [Kineococcus sp. TRM81007]MCI2238698.1 LacI family transcriptional regulator [Kineococcus sp. TRM81007]MCI3927360.1 LacI family transcriptional regulator [Paenibacillus sp. TRM 82003]
MRTGIKDVARLAGVSVGTVSHVLNHPQLVSSETAERVREAMRQLGYVRNEPARQLALRGRSELIAVVLPTTTDPFFLDVVHGAQQAAALHGLEVMVASSEHDVQREHRQLETLEQRRVRGVLLSPAVDASLEGVRALQERGTPLVLVGPVFGEHPFCSVSIDERSGGRQVGAHLARAGHRRVVFAGAPLSAHHVHERCAGMAETLPDADVQAVDVSGWQPGGGLPALGELLDAPPRRRPTAIACANDLIALEALAECVQRGLAVPEQVAVVGYDDMPFTRSAAVSLSTVSQPQREMGRCATELLLREDGDGAGHEHERVVLQPTLLARRTSDRVLPARRAVGPARERSGG